MIGLIGLDHHWAPADVRGRLTFTAERLDAALRALVAAPEIAEALVLSTCNRTEVYVSAPHWPEARAAVERFLVATHAAGPEAPVTAVPSVRKAGGHKEARYSAASLLQEAGLEQGSAEADGPLDALRPLVVEIPELDADSTLPEDFARYIYVEEGARAAHHLFRVAAGLRSMLIGESQILGQVKEALAAAEAVGSIGEELRSLATQAIKVGKRARTETQIGRVDRSLGAAAVEVASDSLGGLTGKAALVIGAGRTSQMCAHGLRESGIARLVLANRSARAAQDLAAEVGGEAIALDDIRDVIRDIDLIVSATAAPHLVLPAASVACGLAGRHNPLVIVDLAVPADVDPAAGLLPQVSLYTLDMLRPGGDGGDGDIQAADLEKAEAIVDAGTREWVRGRHMRQAVPGIAALRRHVDRSEQVELTRALDQLSHLSDADKQVVARLGERLVDKMFHHLVARIRSLAEYDEVPPEVTMQVLARLFADPDEDKPAE